MTTNRLPVVLTPEAASDEDVVGSNVSVVNAMYQTLLTAEEMAPEALRSYFVDFYLAQSLDGGFAQYVFMTPDRVELDGYIREGLAAMGASGHLELFNRATAFFDSLSDADKDAYLEGGAIADERPDGVTAMEALDNEFEELLETEDVTGLNAAWLRSQDGLLVLDGAELAAHIAARVAEIPDLAERQAEADSENTPEFEAIIGELCAVAGHELEKITRGDPNFEHNGKNVLAWHFTTDKGSFIMIEEESEALMINPETKDVIALLEFDEDEFAIV